MITSMIPNPDNVFGICSGGGGSTVADAWVRPTEWLALPDNVDGVQKVSILNAVFDTDSELVAFSCSGNYTVNWGDGVVENFVGSTKAEHKYTYSDVDLNIDTVSKFGYKQCIITITPQVGHNISEINMNINHSSISTSTAFDITSGFLDVRINALSCLSIYIGLATSYIKHSIMQQCLIGELADTTLNELFYDCYSLQSVSIKDTSNVTTFASIHQNNYALRKMPLYDYTSCATLANAIDSCHSIKDAGHFNTTSLLTTVSGMCSNCWSLEKAPTFSNSSGVTNIASMLNVCKSLTNIPSYIFGNVSGVNAGLMLSQSDSLQICPNIIVGSVYTANNNFLQNNYSLKRMLMPLRFTFSVANAKMSATALNEMYSILPTVIGQTVTVTGNYGVSGDNPAIATAKGWTVTG